MSSKRARLSFAGVDRGRGCREGDGDGAVEQADAEEPPRLAATTGVPSGVREADIGRARTGADGLEATARDAEDGRPGIPLPLGGGVLISSSQRAPLSDLTSGVGVPNRRPSANG